jgi:type II protein arginine methyltransferase
LEFKALLGHSGLAVQLILVLNEDIPSWEHFNVRWTGEKIHSIQLDHSVFIKNAKGFPVLPKKHQETVKAMMRFQIRIILRSRHPNDTMENYFSYMCHVFKTHDKLDEEDRIEVSYRNYLQSPLQPLADNLESSTYEVFENDKIKYDIYEDSLYKAFLDKKKYGRFLQTKKI